MRNIGTGKWREMRYANTVIALLPADPKKPRPADEKSLTEIFHMTMTALKAKDSLAKLTEGIAALNEDKKPGEGITEQQLRDTIQEIANSELDQEAVDAIFGKTPTAESQNVGLPRVASKKSAQGEKEG
mmetsp:Transcript_57299/g.150816  ORF Transcript_57299/g.150816 Transcript_57299/m.150816 type:complete len:129 (+) Transcript_57299:91-477(+)